MAEIKLSLQNRITLLLVIFSVSLVSVFVLIQLNNQLANIQRQNSYQANLSSIIAKNNLEAVMRQVQPDQIASYLNSTLKELKDAGIIPQAILFDHNGKIVASTEKRLVGEKVMYRDINKIEELQLLAEKDILYKAHIDRLRKELNIYIALKIIPEGIIDYVGKITFPLGNIQEALIAVYKPAILASIAVIIANILFGFFLARKIIGPIKILNEVTKIIAKGNLSVRTEINTNDELEELGQTFNYMTEELVKMKERAENANPLTKLPGNIVIHDEVEKRIKENRKFTVIYCDLDNFKAFNDKYGIAKGDEAIKLTAEIFKEAVKTRGSADDFIGHEGGDDFILLTIPEKAQEVADYIIKEFDQRIRSLYSQEDINQGYIVTKSRDNVIKKFPIMTISLAGVTNATRVIQNYAEVTNIAAEVKKKVKSVEASIFVLDKRCA